MEKLSAARLADLCLPIPDLNSGIIEPSLELAKGFEPLTL